MMDHEKEFTKPVDLREPQGRDGLDLFEAIASGSVISSHVATDLPACANGDRTSTKERKSRSSGSEAAEASRVATGSLGEIKRPSSKRSRSRSREAAASIHPLSVVSVFSNLIIMEDAFRTQYTELQQSRRKNLIFFYVMVAIAVYLTWLNFAQPSMYQWIRLLERLVTIADYISLGLFCLTGLYTKTFVAAPRFLPDANKGLREFNVRLVKTPGTWRERAHRIVDPVYSVHLGGLVKIVLSTRAFSPHYVEAWEVYRLEFWEKEERRRQNRKIKTSTLSSGDAGRERSGKKSHRSTPSI